MEGTNYKEVFGGVEQGDAGQMFHGMAKVRVPSMFSK